MSPGRTLGRTAGLLAASIAWLVSTTAEAWADGQGNALRSPLGQVQARWFVAPPPAKKSLAGNGTHLTPTQVAPAHTEDVETIVVTAAKRPIQRDPHDEELHEFRPLQSDAAAPMQGNVGQGACNRAAYQTIGGQPATGMDMISMGGGQC
jgi:hypothetical protein